VSKFLLVHVGIVREVLQKLVHSSGVSISTPIWQTLCSYAEMHKIFIAEKSHCVCRVLSIATIRSKYYFNFTLIRTRSGRELFDRPSYWAQTFLHPLTDFWGKECDILYRDCLVSSATGQNICTWHSYRSHCIVRDIDQQTIRQWWLFAGRRCSNGDTAAENVKKEIGRIIMSLAHVIYNVHALVADRMSQVNITALVMVCYRLGGVSK